MKLHVNHFVAAILLLNAAVASAEEFAPYGTAKVDMHEYPTINAVIDLNYENPNDMNILYNFVNNTQTPLKGKMVDPIPLPVKGVRYLDQPQGKQ